MTIAENSNQLTALGIGIEAPDRNRRYEMNRNKTKRKKIEDLTPDQIAWNIPIGAAMEGFFNTATEQDFQIQSEIYHALCAAVDSAPKGAGGKHLAMAALNLAHVAVLACAQHAQRTVISEDSVEQATRLLS